MCLAGIVWFFCRNVCGMPCAGHSGNAGQHSHTHTPDFLPARAGPGDHRNGGGEAGGIPSLFLDRTAPDSVKGDMCIS